MFISNKNYYRILGRLRDLESEVRKLKDINNWMYKDHYDLMEYLGVEFKHIPETPAKRVIVKIEEQDKE